MQLIKLMISLVNQLFFTDVKMQSINLLKQFLKKIIIVKKITKKYFNKNLVMSVEDKKDFNQVIDVGYVINYLLMKIKK